MSEYRISNVLSQREEQVKYRVEKRAAAIPAVPEEGASVATSCRVHAGSGLYQWCLGGKGIQIRESWAALVRPADMSSESSSIRTRQTSRPQERGCRQNAVCEICGRYRIAP